MAARSRIITVSLVLVVWQVLACTFAAYASKTLTPAEQKDLLTQAAALFHEANESYAANRNKARELYRKSLLRFERLADSGIQNGKLYYNIGNVYFRLEDIGRAIVNYRRAEQFIPHDENLKQNLQYALAKRVDKIEDKQQERILKTLFFFHYDLSSKTRFIIFSVFYSLFWLALALKLLAAKPFSRAVFFVPLIVACLFAVSTGIETFSKPFPRGVIVKSAVVARKGDGNSYQASYNEPLHAGTDFSLIEDRGGWLHIEIANGDKCWIPSSSAEMI